MRRFLVPLAAAALIGSSSASALSAPVAAVAPRIVTSQVASSYQINSAHNGISIDTVHGPWRVGWHTTFAHKVTYPVIAQGLVAVGVLSTPAKVATYHSTSGRHAWTDVLSGITGLSMGITYSGGVLYALGESLTAPTSLYAIAMASGRILWHIQFSGNNELLIPPVALGGQIYIVGSFLGSTIADISNKLHRIAWQRPQSTDVGLLAVDGEGVYYSGVCDADGAYSLTGGLLWHLKPTCEGGGWDTPVLVGTSVFERDQFDGDVELNASTGMSEGTYSSTFAPLVVGGVLYATSNGALVATSLSTDSQVFSFSPVGACLTGPAQYVDGVVYVLSGCGGSTAPPALYGVSPSGSQVSMVSLPYSDLEPILGYSDDGSGILQDFAEGGGIFEVSSGDTIAVLLPAN